MPQVIEIRTSSEPQLNECDVTDHLLPNPTPNSISNVCIALASGQKNSYQEDSISTGAISGISGGTFYNDRGKLSPSSTNSQDPMMATSMSIKELLEEDEDDTSTIALSSNQPERNFHRGSSDSNTITHDTQIMGAKSMLSLPNEDVITSSTKDGSKLDVGSDVCANVNSSTSTNSAAQIVAITNNVAIAEGSEKIRRKLSVQGEYKLMY